MDQRVRKLNDATVRDNGRYVLYRIRANRRAENNHALAFAAGLASHLDLPLLVFESLSTTYPYANDRLHTFVLEGVAETADRLRSLGAGYVFHLERRRGSAEPALRAIACDAAAVVTDDYPETLAPRADPGVQAFAVDSSCVVPASAIEGRAYAAYSIRPKIHKLLPRFLKPAPAVQIRRRFRERLPEVHTEVCAERIPELVASCDIDHAVRSSPSFRGGRDVAQHTIERFLHERLHRYAREKNEPSAHATSDLSPYLHLGYISALEVALAVRDYAKAHKLIADEFLEELIVRRELAFNFAWHATRLDTLEALPDWARATLDAHRRDRRDPAYSRAQFEAAATHDNLWNATEKELLVRGKIHGYYRMYWGKKILEWSKTPEEALATMLYFHERYALDGQDPNTYANILWCFGLHDRPWPERSIYGTVRSMSRAGMDRKTDTAAYIREMEELAA
jgi:deoxyribodipyrimidine photo-lyase